MDGNLWHFRAIPSRAKPTTSETGQRRVTVATTRPETMLGDTGAAVHPDDERYKICYGRNVVLPIVGRLIPWWLPMSIPTRKGNRRG